MKDKILSALKKLGPSGPTAVARDISEEPHLVGYHMRSMEKGKQLKAIGTGRSRYYGLPDQDLASLKAPPQERTAPASRRRAKPKARRAAKPAPAARPAMRFIPVVDAEKRLYIINGGEPLTFDEAQTLKIAELLFVHYEA